MLRKFLLFVFALSAMAQIGPPRVGYIVDPHGALRPVTGVAGAFKVGAPIEKDVISAAFSGKTLVVKKDRELLMYGERFDAPQGRIEVRFSSKGDLTEVFFPESSSLWTWRNGKFDESFGAPADWRLIEIYDGEVSIGGEAVRLPSRALKASQLGEDWLVIYAEKATYAVRQGCIFELPEGEE
jgi:hypothetical protein